MNQIVTVRDSCSVESFIKGNQSLINEKRKKAPCVGLVRLIQDGKVISTDQTVDGWLTNVTVGLGREFVAQKVFGLASTRTANMAGPATIDVTGFSVTHFGIGAGGSVNAIPPTLVTPTVADTKLNTPLEINATALSYDSGTGIQTLAAKPITSGGTVVFQTDPLSNNNYSTVKCTCVIGASEPITNELGLPLTTGNAAKIDEAMLFASSGTSLIPFAHIAFMPKFIEFESTLTIEWFIIF